MAAPLPANRRDLEAMAAELVDAERAVAGRLATVRAIEVVCRQSRDERFRCPEAQAHLAAELARLRAILAEPWPSLVHSGPHLMLPDRGLAPAEYLAAFHREVVRLQREVAAKLAEENDPTKETQAAAPASEPIIRTLEILAGSKRGAELVRYLAARDDRRAHLDDIVVDVYKRRRCNATSAYKTIRKQIERTEERLNLEGSPMRLTIDDNTVYLTLTTNQ